MIKKLTFMFEKIEFKILRWYVWYFDPEIRRKRKMLIEFMDMYDRSLGLK